MLPCLFAVHVALALQAPAVGERPYEMVWANRDRDEHPALVDFEKLTGWKVETTNAEATFEGSRERLLFGEQVGKLSYRATGAPPKVFVRPPAPIPCPTPFDAVSLWIYGNNWGWMHDPSTPQVQITAHFATKTGADVPVYVFRVDAEYWFLAYRKLSPEQVALLRDGATFTGFEFTNGRNTDQRSFYLDSFCVFKEEPKPLAFDPRPQRGIAMFPGQGSGTNTGPGKLPFPTRAQTILPTNLTDRFKTTVQAEGDAFVFTYRGDDGTLTWRLAPQTGTFGDVSAQWLGRGAAFRPMVDGGLYLAGQKGPIAPEKAEHLGSRVDGDTVVSRWRLSGGGASTEATFTWRLWQKSLVIDVKAPGGQVAAVRYGRAVGLDHPRLTQIPFLANGSGRAHAVIAGPPAQPLFLMSHTDWYLSNASVLHGAGAIDEQGATYNGGLLYHPKTDGRRNDVFERLFVTVSPRFEEVLPTVANPVSPWKHVTGKGVWRAHGAGNREHDAAFWRNVWRHGMKHVIVTDHETGWRDEGESFTFRTRTAPKRGGDESQFRYARVMQDELGFVYGPYNNYTDFAPVNEYWSPDHVSRLSDGQLETAWPRCYAPKPAWAVEMCAKLAPIIQQKFKFSTAYCDVHTAVAPWHRTDYDARVPGAGTFAATFYSFGEIMLHQKQAWGGPVYSEGGHHCYLHGLTDGNYGQDQGARLPDNPWLVDFDLHKLHDLGCNFGMGAPSMFYGERHNYGRNRQELDFSIDRFLAATIAFGHPGFLVFEAGGLPMAMRSYYLVQQLAADYTQSSVATIRYAEAGGKLLDTSAALGTGDFQRNQIVTTYANGTVTVVNGSKTERMRVAVGRRQLELPAAGFAGWTADGRTEVFAGEVDGQRLDYVSSPEYLYFDGRGRFSHYGKAAGDGQAACRVTPDGGWELIPEGKGECGFAIGAATATALDAANKPLGKAEVRVARGLTYVVPVKDAVSYQLKPVQAAAVPLTCDRWTVVAGETVTVKGQTTHQVKIPADLPAGRRHWVQLDGGWIDFTVAALADAELALDGDRLTLTLTGNLAGTQPVEVTLRGARQAVSLPYRRPVTVVAGLGPAQREGLDPVALLVKAGEMRTTREWTLRTVRETRDLAAVPEIDRSGLCLRKQPETGSFAGTGGAVHLDPDLTCGGKARKGIFMHPPYQTGVGYSFALLRPITLPATPPAVFRCQVGKRDGGDLGDGILFIVSVVEAGGKVTEVGRQHVPKHEWRPLSADLSRWAGQTIQLKLVADVGPNDDSSADWACWGDLQIQSTTPVLHRTLQADGAGSKLLPAPYPVAGLGTADLRAAKRAWLRYDGCGLEGPGTYGKVAVVNGVEIGTMPSAGGDEVNGVWAEKVGLPLTPAAIATLGGHNVFRIQNPRGDSFKIRNFWIELELADGRKASSRVSAAVYTQPPGWPYFEGIGVEFGSEITVDVWFDLKTE